MPSNSLQTGSASVAAASASGSGSAATGGGGGRGGNHLPLVRALLAKGAVVNEPVTSSAMAMSYIGRPTKGAFENFSCGTGDFRGATALWLAAFTANGGFGGGFAADAPASGDEGSNARADQRAPICRRRR